MAEERTASSDFQPTGFFAFRTALLPFHVLRDWARDMTAHRAVDTAVEALVAHERRELATRLKTIVADAAVLEGLFLASPSIHRETIEWLARPELSNAKLERALTRYVQRMAGRATPFGLMAGCSIGYAGHTGRAELSISGADTYRRSSRLDNGYLAAVADHLSRREEVRQGLKYWPTSSLYRLGNRWRYVKVSFDRGVKSDKLVALDADEFLDCAINRAQDGATIDELVDAIFLADSDGDITRGEALEYVLQLVEYGVIVSSLRPIVTGPEPLADLVRQLESSASPLARQATAVLRDVQRRLATIDALPLGIDTGKYEQIAAALGPLSVPFDQSNLFQVDMVKPAPHSRLATGLVERIMSGVRLLHLVTPPATNEPLRRFKEAFTSRYEQREVNLMEALDEESGIGFESSAAAAAENAPLLDRIPLGAAGKPSAPSWRAREAVLLSKLQDIWGTGAKVIELSDKDVERLTESERLPLADAFCARVSLIGSGDDPHILIRDIAGPSGANILGRFCHVDPELHRLVTTQLTQEEALRPDAVFAEIVHLPEGRVGNILSRPLLRQYEIPYLGRSGAPATHQIPVSDILVSVVDDRIVLRSGRLGRELLPRLTNMHNYYRGHTVYRFLCSLQTQNITSVLAWNWGALETVGFLPRVTYRNIILTRARWRIGTTLVDKLIRGSAHEQFASIQQWRNQQRLPRFVALADGDNELPVDFENVLSVETLLHLIKGRDSATLFEMFPGSTELPVRGPEGQFVHEIIVPFVKTQPHATLRPAVRTAPPRIQRSFPPGSNWLYVKWYGGTAAIDVVISELLPTFVAAQMASATVLQWFFVRYSDPDWHVRLRFCGDGEPLVARTLAALSSLSGEARRRGIWKIQVDTYEREVERYGGDHGIELSEQLFWHDSQAVIDILQMLPSANGMDARWRLCMRSWDLLLSDFGFDLNLKLEFVREMRHVLARQVDESRHLKRALGDRFRKERESLEALFDEGLDGHDPLAAAVASLRKRSHALSQAMHELREHARTGRLTVPLTALATSHLHMHANRMLRSSHQAQELVMYDFLGRMYESALARRRKHAGASARMTI